MVKIYKEEKIEQINNSLGLNTTAMGLNSFLVGKQLQKNNLTELKKKT